MDQKQLTTSKTKHTFVNHLVQLLEDMDGWEQNEEVSKLDMVKSIRSRILHCMRAGLVHPFTSFYSLEASTVVSGTAAKDEQEQGKTTSAPANKL